MGTLPLIGSFESARGPYLLREVRNVAGLPEGSQSDALLQLAALGGVDEDEPRVVLPRHDDVVHRTWAKMAILRGVGFSYTCTSKVDKFHQLFAYPDRRRRSSP